jgi:hypothetical protein
MNKIPNSAARLDTTVNSCGKPCLICGKPHLACGNAVEYMGKTFSKDKNFKVVITIARG